jgi:translation initiation factor IF-1
MAKPGEIETTGRVIEIPGGGRYKVLVEDEQIEDWVVTCYLAGKMKQHKINVIVGDKVRVVIPPPYEIGRITYREK